MSFSLAMIAAGCVLFMAALTRAELDLNKARGLQILNERVSNQRIIWVVTPGKVLNANKKEYTMLEGVTSGRACRQQAAQKRALAAAWFQHSSLCIVYTVNQARMLHVSSINAAQATLYETGDFVITQDTLLGPLGGVDRSQRIVSVGPHRSIRPPYCMALCIAYREPGSGQCRSVNYVPVHPRGFRCDLMRTSRVQQLRRGHFVQTSQKGAKYIARRETVAARQRPYSVTGAEP